MSALPLSTRALYVEVAELLRERIFAQALAPGSWIDELKLSEEYGISRTPLREALKVLAAEGLVTMKLRRGAYVTEVSERDLREVYHLLALLESDAAAVVAEGLAKVGIPGAYEGALPFVGNPELISRTHFARFLVESGVCKDTNEVFRRFLTEGKPGYVPHRWASLSQAVTWITAAGGVAVIAHPARYKFTPNEEYALFSEFKAHGGRAVEVVTGSHSAQEYLKYADTAREFGLAASRGSDFHSPDESHTDLGTLPFLPGQLTPVWELLEDRIQ